MISEMSSQPFNNVSGEFLFDARQYAADGSYIASLQKYLMYFSKTPRQLRAADSEKEFVELLCDLDVFFQDKQAIGELIKCFLYSFMWFPNNAKLNNTFGVLLSRDDEHRQALRYMLRAYKFALENDEPRLGIEKNILHLIWTQIPRWHFRMLNGKTRNEAYRTAIHRALNKGFTNVVDIGSGCGLLGLYAGIHESRPDIVAYEANETLYRKNVHLAGKYCKGVNFRCINIYSYLHDKFEQARRNLLVTEIFDVAVFGEGILNTLKHAFKHHMVEKNFAVIPASVTLYVTGINSKSLDRKFRLHNKHPCFGNLCVTKLTDEDPYDAEVLLHETYEILTETSAFMKVSLDNETAVDYLLDGKLNFIVNLEVLKEGYVDSLVVWFDLHLDSETVVSTNPFHEHNEPCWEQAIFHCKHPVKVAAKEALHINVSIQDERLVFEFLKPPLCDSFRCFKHSEAGVQFLNDELWVDYLIAISETIPETGQFPKIVVDFCAFPLVGILLAKKGYKVYHFYKEEKDLQFIERVLTLNNVDYSLSNFVDYEIYPQFLLSLKKIDYLMYEPVLQDGSLNYSPLDNVAFRKFKPEHFIQDVIVNFVLINSTYLDYCNVVNKDNVEPFEELAKEMNEFIGTEHPGLSHDFPHEKMSTEQSWNFGQKPSTIETVQALKDGTVNGILTWFTLISKDGLRYNTKESSYFNKNVLIFPARKIEAEQAIKLLCRYEERGAFKIEICEEMWLRTNFERVSNASYMADFLEKNACE